jgi:hypothetical protein
VLSGTIAPPSWQVHPSEVMVVAERKKGSSKGASGSAHAFAVVVEEMRGHFKAFGERLDGFGQRLDGIDGRLDGIDRRLDGIDVRLDGIDVRLDGIDVRLDGIDRRLDGIDGRLDDLTHDMGLVKTAVLEHSRALKQKVDR